MLTVDRFVRSGKVRDLYDLPDGRLLLVASDRISAFDVVLPTEVPDKGRVLTGLSRFWFAETAGLVPNHLVSTDPGDDPALRGRVMVCRPTDVVPIEAVVRGYLAGSGWKEYRTNGSVCGIALPPGLHESSQLPEPIFTPATKAERRHDENIDRPISAAVCVDRPSGARPCARLYRHAARDRGVGILLADTKFESIDRRAGSAPIDELTRTLTVLGAAPTSRPTPALSKLRARLGEGRSWQAHPPRCPTTRERTRPATSGVSGSGASSSGLREDASPEDIHRSPSRDPPDGIRSAGRA